MSKDQSAPPPKSLAPEALYRVCPPEELGCKTTLDLEEVAEPVGQSRALDAVRFGTSVRHPGYNIFVLGPQGSGKHTAVATVLSDRCRRASAPCDWAYVNNFKDPQHPRALRLEPGSALRLRDGMKQLIDDLRTAIPAVFESEEYRKRRQAIDAEFGAVQEKALDALREKAAARGIALVNTPQGMTFAAVKDNELVSPQAFQALPQEQQEQIIAAISDLQKDLGDLMFRLPKVERARRDKIRTLNRELAKITVEGVIDDLDEIFATHKEAHDFLEEVESDLVENVHSFLPNPQGEGDGTEAPGRVAASPYRRYEVNVLVSNDPQKGAPLVEEVFPSLSNLAGRIEHVAQMGALVTDFKLIRPGALHKANGGILMLDARRILTQPYAWEALKRMLRAGEIRIEHPFDGSSLITTQTLEPAPIPLDVKIVMFGDRELYYLLAENDPDFPDLFKIEADFDEVIERNGEGSRHLARLIATIARRSKTRPIGADAVARMVEQASKMAGDAKKLLVLVTPLADLVREADAIANQAGHETVTRADVEAALEAQRHRAGRIRERMEEMILRDMTLIATEGRTVGQINGLSVLGLPGVSFGRPTRITARVRPGAGEVVDIEREVALGGPIHSKGMLILQGYLGGQYSPDKPLSLAASLVFEQSYGGVDGDSASMAELLTLLSAIAEVPLRQDFAITGSVNQRGESQVIGGVNEKIEGFFDVCAKRGLTGTQGVAIPKGNVDGLMLRADVVEAARAGKFAIVPYASVEEAIELFTGMTAGTRGAEGAFPEGSFNRQVQDRLAAFTAARVKAGAGRSRWRPW